MSREYRKAFDKKFIGSGMTELNRLVKECEDLISGRLMAHADGSVTKQVQNLSGDK